MQLVARLVLPARRPLVTVEWLMIQADEHEYEIERALESGAIEHAWNIASQQTERRELRMWNESALAYVEQRPARHFELATLFPHSRAEVTSTELERLFTCSSTHIHNLIAQRLLAATGERIPRGRNSAVKITRASVEQFFEARKIS